MNTWYDHIKIEDLPEDYQMAAGAIGIDNVIKLAEALPSTYIYLKHPNVLFLSAKRKFILDAYAAAGPENPWRPRLVALAAGVSIDFVYKLLKERADDSKQGELFNSD